MPDPVRTKLTLIGATAVAFTGGVLLASGLNLTPGGHAAVLLQQAPSRSDVKPVADLSDAFISIAESVTPAVVSIDTERQPRRGDAGGGEEDSQVPEEFRRMFPGFRMPDQNAPQEARGSGFIISADGFIVTNNHVVEGADKIDVVLQDNRHLHATVVGRDPLTDIAVIKVTATGLPTVRLGTSETARIGEWVLAIGNPLDLGTTVTSGIISAKGRGLGIIGQTSGSRWAIEDFIQTDAPINPGNSGGPLVNLRGEVVGVNSAIASRTGYYSGYGFAVPVDLARRIADDLIRYHEVRRPALGVQITEVTPEDAEVFRLERIQGVVAQDFTPGSPAERAGLRQGDVIVAVDGKPIQRVGQFQRVIAGYHPGDQVTLDVIRYGQRRQLKVTLIQAQTEPSRVAQDDRPAAAPDGEGGRLGVAVGPVTTELARKYGYSGTTGLAVTDVQPYGPAARGGLQEGMRILAVDGQAVTDVAAFRAAMARKRAGDIVSLQVQAGPQRSILNIRLPD
jgi:serine protease Do